MKKLLKNKNSHIILGFLIPVLFFIGLGAMFQLYPFSTKAAAPYDAKHQYLSFLQEYKTKLLSGESLFFSKRMASTDFYTEWLYYLTSPFNLIALFIKDIFIAFQVIVVIKIGCIGASMAAYLKKSYGGGGLQTAIFSAAYALSSYVMSYYFSIMWLDILIILPWLVFSFELMIKKKNIWLYSLLLGAVIYSNFFMAMHVCIFLCIYFLLYDHKDLKGLFTSAVRFALLSLLGGGIGAAFFIPFLTLFGDKQGTIPDLSLLCGFDELFMGFGTLAKKQVSMDFSSNANFYCGLVVFILFVMYITNKQFDLRERMKHFILCGFLFLCTNVSILNFFINGFYKTKGYMGRYTYLMIFFMVCGAYKEFLVLRQETLRRKIFSLMFCVLFFGTSFTSLSVRDKLGEDLMLNAIATLVILLVFFVIVYARMDKKWAAWLLMLELVVTSFYGFKVSDISDLKGTMKSISAFNIETDARSEMLPMAIHNEEALNKMNGISLFSSSLPEIVSQPQYRLGTRGGSNYITAYGCELVPSLLYNIQYIYGEDDEYLGFTKIEEGEERSLFQNNYETAYAYHVPEYIKNWDWSNTNSFSNINAFVSFFVYEKLFDVVDSKEITFSSDYEKIEPYLSGTYSAQRIRFTKGDGTYIEAAVTAEKPELAVCISHGWFKECKIYINNELYMDDKNIEGDIIYIKGVNKGDKVSIRLHSNKEEATMGIMFAYYNMDVYEKFAEDLSSRRIDVDFTDNKISGSYDIPDGEAIMISTPSIKGWGTQTNGEEAEIIDFPFVLFTPDKSSGNMRLIYITPLFFIGLPITMFSIGIVLILIIIDYNNRKKPFDLQLWDLKGDGK